MLSCRYSGPGTAHYNRRLESADRVLAMFSDQDPENLTPLPLVPYAMSVCTCAIYRALRDGVRNTDAGHRDLRSCCNVLDSLCPIWTITKGMAKLATRLCSIPQMSIPGRSSAEAGQLSSKRTQLKPVANETNNNVLSIPYEVGYRPTQTFNDAGVVDSGLESLNQPVQHLHCEPLSFVESYQRTWEIPSETCDDFDGPLSQFDSFLPGMFNYGLLDYDLPQGL